MHDMSIRKRRFLDFIKKLSYSGNSVIKMLLRSLSTFLSDSFLTFLFVFLSFCVVCLV